MPLESFFSLILGAKEPSIMLAQNNDERATFAEALQNKGFTESHTVGDLFRFSKTFIVIRNEFKKEVYDFLMQYATGHVEIFDQETMESRTLSPNYSASSIVILINKDAVHDFVKQGVNLLALSGLAYQS